MSSTETDDASESSCASLEEPITEVTYIYDVPSPCSEDFDTDLEDSGEKKYIVAFRKYAIHINYNLLFNNE